MTKTFTFTNSVVNRRLFHHHGHQYLVLISFLCVQLSTKNNSTRISLLPRQSPTPLDRLLFKIIHDNWNYFCEVGSARPMLDFEFCIDTGNFKVTCSRQPTNGIYERKITTEHISQLKNNHWIRDRAGYWGDLLLLAAEPHQESCVDIDKFAWRLRPSYCPLNSVTRSSKFPIPRCSNSI